MRKLFVLASIILVATFGFLGHFLHETYYGAFLILAPLIGIGIKDMFDRKHTIMRNYPVFGRLRYVMEELRPKIYQYFIESDTDGAPLNRVARSMVYQRAKKENDTMPFGTPFDIGVPGHEWINHSMYPLAEHMKPDDLRVTIGGKHCKRPYSASILNISAMSYGALSKTAVEALNWGAKVGNFAHNTGEGGVSPYHIKHGGDLIWQIGTGYFGCRDDNGNFSPELFKKQVALNSIKMVEIKLSQGAKPGHGGILPGAKNTPEIAAIRKVKPGETVLSPPGHSAFHTPMEMLQFITELRELSEGKPIGIKMCVGNPEEVRDLIQTMQKSGIAPDYISVDGAEGGTGSAPPEFSNSVGMALRDGVILVSNLLNEFGLKGEVKLLCAGKLISGFDVVRMLSLGADACYSARGMMLSLGCIQALECNKNKCPAGVATQNPALYKGLVVEEKYLRVRNFHHGTLESVAELLAAAGVKDLSELKRSHIWRRISFNEIKSYEDIFPYPAQNMKKAA